MKHEYFCHAHYYCCTLISFCHAERFNSNCRRKSMNLSAVASLLCDFTQLEQLPSFARVLL